jgi:hypothetical protein
MVRRGGRGVLLQSSREAAALSALHESEKGLGTRVEAIQATGLNLVNEEVMATVLEQYKAQLALLSNQERAELVYFLLQSLEPEEYEGVEAASDAEVRQRVDRNLRGQTKGTPADQVFESLARFKG